MNFNCGSIGKFTIPILRRLAMSHGAWMASASSPPMRTILLSGPLTMCCGPNSTLSRESNRRKSRRRKGAPLMRAMGSGVVDGGSAAEALPERLVRRNILGERVCERDGAATSAPGPPAGAGSTADRSAGAAAARRAAGRSVTRRCGPTVSRARRTGGVGRRCAVDHHLTAARREAGRHQQRTSASYSRGHQHDPHSVTRMLSTLPVARRADVAQGLKVARPRRFPRSAKEATPR